MGNTEIDIILYVLLFLFLGISIFFSSLTIKQRALRNSETYKLNQVSRDEFVSLKEDVNNKFDTMIKEIRAIGTDRKKDHEREFDSKITGIEKVLDELNQKVNDHCESNVFDFKTILDGVDKSNQQVKVQSRKVNVMESLVVRLYQNEANERSKSKSSKNLDLINLVSEVKALGEEYAISGGKN